MTWQTKFERPDRFPDYAMQDVNNGPAAAPNVEEPEPVRKAEGWYSGEEPPRQYFNWLHRLTARWIRNLDRRTSRRLAKFYRYQ